MKKYFFHIGLNLWLSSIAMPALAVDLIDVYQQATVSDPTFQEAKATRLANREALPQSIAALLPNLSATADTTGNYVKTVRAPVPDELGTFKFNSKGYTVTLTQPIINFGSLASVYQARATAKQADAVFGAAAQDLIIRVASAYFNVLLAQDDLRYTRAEREANARQLDQVKERFKVGLETITTVYNAQSSYDAVIASEIAAENTLRNSNEALRQLTGTIYPMIEGLKIKLPLICPDPTDVEQWVSAAEMQNLNLLAARFATQAAHDQVKINFAGHLPVVNAVGTYGRNNGQSLGTTDTVAGSIGLQLNMPIYQGGLVVSQTRQAQDKYAAASANMEQQHRQITITTRQKYNDVLADISKIKADRQAVVSAQSSLDSTQEAFKVGTRTIVDVLLAQQQLYQTKRNYAQDEYTYLNDTLLLKQAAGTLKVADLQSINDWLHLPS